MATVDIVKLAAPGTADTLDGAVRMVLEAMDEDGELSRFDGPGILIVEVWRRLATARLNGCTVGSWDTSAIQDVVTLLVGEGALMFSPKMAALAV